MSALLGLPPGLAWLVVATCLLAGAIRGFAGFGLSALAMAALGSLIPPVQLLPVFWCLEMAASLVLMRGGWADAERRTALILTVTAAAVLPVALLVNLSLDPVLSKTLALSLLIGLAGLQLARVRLAFLDSTAGTALAGAGAGIVTGFSGAGGLFVALYALARALPARTMRGTLNIYILGGGTLGLVTHLAVGTMDATAATRGALLVVPTLAGVVLGRALFVPRWERWYRPLCLVLLVGLAGSGLLRLATGG